MIACGRRGCCIPSVKRKLIRTDPGYEEADRIMTIRRITAMVITLILLLTGTVTAEYSVPTIETDVVKIKKYGNLVLGISPESLLDPGL